MTKYRRGPDREEFLADVAEMYYQNELTQAQISREIGLTRSAVSRMLSEAREKGIVEIIVHRPLRFEEELEAALLERFDLAGARVLLWQQRPGQYGRLRRRLGRVAAGLLQGLLNAEMVLGVAWGTTVNATIEALPVDESLSLEVVQLVGVLGSESHAFNAQALVSDLARKFNGRATYLYSPFIVENAATARSIRSIPAVNEALAMGRRSDIALLGIGTTEPKHCTLLQSGHITRSTLDDLVQAGAVGDVCALFYDHDGRQIESSFHDQLVGITCEDLKEIPIRLGVAGHTDKADAILGALHGGFVNMLVTDSETAQKVLGRERVAGGK